VRLGRVLGTGIAGLLLARSPCVDASAACLTAEVAGQTAEGRLASILFVDFAGRREHAYILELAASACLEGGREDDKVESSKRIHVYSMAPGCAARCAAWSAGAFGSRAHCSPSTPSIFTRRS